MEIIMSNEVLATVAGKEITQADFDRFAKTLPQEQQAYLQNPQAKEYFVEQLLSLYLFAEMGKEEKLDETEAYKTNITNAKRDILGQLAMHKALDGVTVSDEEVKAFYEEHKANYQQGETVSAKHILMDSEDEIKDVLSKIQSGETTFEDAAAEYSTCPSKERGGDLGQFGRGQMVKEFEDVAFAAELGKVAGPVKTQFGFHLIKPETRTEAVTQTFDDVAENVRTAALQEKQQTVFNKKIAELKEKYCK
jgi:peptidyl-prolyl cis-trans isomerase C